MRRAFLGCAVLACAACSAIAGLNKDYVVDESTTAPTEDAGPVDAVAVPPADAGGSVDASVDARALPFCDGGGLFCTDFEATATVKPEWTRTEATGSEPTLVPAIGVGGSRALDAKMTAGAGTAATVAWRSVGTMTFPIGRTVTLTFSFNVRTKATNYAAIGVIQVGGTEHGLAMYDSSKCNVGGPCLDENDQGVRGHDSSNSIGLTLNQWHTGLVSVTRTNAGIGGTVRVDGIHVDDRTTGALPLSVANGTPIVEVGVGSFYSSGAGTNDVVIDDVLVTDQLP